jgi:hypothetical protein
MADELAAAGWPVALYLNGASGNLHTSDPTRGGRDLGLREAGQTLAADALRAIGEMEFTSQATLAASSQEVSLPFRVAAEDEVGGTARGAQRFIDPGIYDALMPALLEEIGRLGNQPAEVQVLSMGLAHGSSGGRARRPSGGDVDFVGVPAEYFVEHGLHIKQAAHPRHALVVGYANGIVGYVPTREAFLRGGYETTFTGSSKLAPEAGDLLAETAIELITRRG